MRAKIILPKTASESAHQRSLITWSQWNISQYPELALLYAIPNGGARDKITGAILKAEGVKPGIPDLHLPVARGTWLTLYIEMKRIGGRASDNQEVVIPLLREQGHRVEICEGWEAARDVIVKYLNLPAAVAKPKIDIVL